MTDREKIIKGLESLHKRLLDAAAQDRIAMLDANIVSDALAMLKAQEPRVMTLDEACSDIDFCWLEIKDYQAVWVSDCVMMPNGRQVLIERLGCDPVAFKPEDYGKTWRCWTCRPTDEQRKAVKWDATT